MGTSELVVAIFPSRALLTKAVDHLTQHPEAKIQKAAIISKAASGETIILGDDISPDEGGIAGGTLGAAMTTLGLVQLGALALPGVGAIIAIGAGVLVGGLVGGATGRFAANLMDSGFKGTQVESLGKQLRSGQPALILEVAADNPEMLKQLKQELKPFRAEFVERPLDTAPLDPSAVSGSTV
jgi:uncharacterized membrane protein